MLFLSGCGNNPDDEIARKTPKKDYDIFIYNSDTSIGKTFREMCDEYTKRTGVIIRTVTPSESDNTIENLDSYINSEFPPDIFTVSNVQELKKWQQTENIWDFNNATEQSFKDVVNSIPQDLRLSSNTTDSFGVPATMEGYGLVVDPKMIASLFGGEKYRKVIDDLQLCSYEEFTYFVEALDLYIKTGASSEFTLNDKTYSFVSSKGELSEKLNGVFSFAAGDAKISGCYLMNPILASIFSSPAEAYIANGSAVEGLSSPLMKHIESLDFISSYAAGNSGTLGRSPELTSTNRNGKSQAIKNFINGGSVFLIASTKDYQNISIFDSLVAKRCMIIPFKVPITEFDIGAGKTFNKNLNKSISVNIPTYYCINARSGGNEKKAAQDFLVWFKTSDLAQKYIVSDFGYVPYDLKTSSVLDNPLERSMLEYVSEKRYLPGVFMGAPGSWCSETMGKYIVNNLLSKSAWTLEDYENASNYGLEKWKELKEA